MSYQTYTDIYAYPPQNKFKEIMDHIRAALEEHDFFISEETFVDHAELVHFHCEDSNKDASDYTDILAPSRMSMVLIFTSYISLITAMWSQISFS